MRRPTAILTMLAALLIAPAAGASVEINAPCPAEHTAGLEAAGCYLPATDTIYYLNRHALWHERGHAFDQRYLTDADRAWLSRRYLKGRPWDAEPGRASAGELFAEAYAHCQQRRTRSRGRFSSRTASYGYRPAGVRHRRLCNTIALIGHARKAAVG